MMQESFEKMIPSIHGKSYKHEEYPTEESAEEIPIHHLTRKRVLNTKNKKLFILLIIQI